MSRPDENGSAEAATSPSHGSNNPDKETAVNEIEDNAAACRHASRIRVEKSLCAIADFDALRRLSLVELTQLHCALTTMLRSTDALVMLASLSDPIGGESQAGSQLGFFAELLADYRDVVIDEASGRKAQSILDAEARGTILLLSEIYDGTEFAQIAHVAACTADHVRDLRTLEAQR